VQSAHATVETALYVPAAQGSHVVAPVPVSVLVMAPAAQAVQAVLVAPVLYVPAVHTVQLDAPVPAKPVEEPAPQAVQADRSS